MALAIIRTIRPGRRVSICHIRAITSIYHRNSGPPARHLGVIQILATGGGREVSRQPVRPVCGRDTDRGSIETAALAEPHVARFLEGQSVRKVIVVPGKIVNIVAAPA